MEISGTITYEDGSPIPAPQLSLVFESQQEAIDAKTYPRPGQAQVNTADGSFSSATTYAPGDGVLVGEHKVVVQAQDENGFPVYKYFPAEYSDSTTTPLRINVGEQREFTLQVPKPKS